MAEGGAIEADGTEARTADGTLFGMADGDQFLIDQLSPGLCRIIFKAARRTNSTILRVGADAIPLRMKGVKGAIAGVRIPADPISDPQSLCARLGRDLVAWNRFVADAQAEGTMGPNQDPLEPPASPGSEP